MIKGSYSFDDVVILEKEIERLNKVYDLGKAIKELQMLIDIGLSDNMYVFDLGCGMSNIDFDIAQHFNNNHIICFDRNKFLINKANEARKNNKISNIDFIIGDAEEIPIADGMIDFCYSRIVFQHLKNPQKVVKELHRITKPGGIVVIADTDDSGLILYPEPKGFNKFIKKVQNKQKKLGGDRFVGRKLWSMLKTEFKDVGCTILPVSNKLIGNDEFINIILGYKSHLLNYNNDLLKRFTSWIQEDNLGIMLTYMVYGKK